MPIWAQLVVVAAAVRVAAAIAFYLAGIYNPDIEAPLPVVAYAALVLSFGALGLLLVAAAGDDVRAAWLGGVLLLLAVPLTSRFLSQTPFALGTFLSRVQPGAFLPAFLWRFACEFPSALPARARPPARVVAAAFAVFGAAAFAINLAIGVWPESSRSAWRAWLATGQAAPSVYWPVLLLMSALGALALVVRMLRSAGDDRVRVRIFVGGLAIGFVPLFVETAVEELWPAYEALVHTPPIESWVAIVLFVPLAFVPFITAYSVVYDRVVDTRLAIRTAIQHALAKYAIAAATLVPFAALLFYLFHYRTDPLMTLMSGPRPLFLAAAVTAGVLSLRSRRRILRAIDRRFFREEYDAHQLVTTLVSDDVMAGSLAEIAANFRNGIERTLHARADLFVLDDEGMRLQDPSGARRPLDARGVLMSLAMADAQPMDVHLHGASVLGRLPDAERAWIEAGRYELVLPIRSRLGEPAGLLALAGKRSELPFSPSDRRTVGSLAAPLALAIENDRLRRGPDPSSSTAALECRACSRLHDTGSARCTCGGTLAEAAVPHVLRGVFRFEKRIGAGGMGVVYRATDLNLRRDVAIKTLPRLTPDHALQLKREAQAMAALSHANLAVIYGIETWRGTPFLVEEYLGGGTLAGRLRDGPLPLTEALRLGTALADVIGQLHAAGIVHCDIKPSNIGFTQSGVMKLLDFGLAYLLRDAGDALTTTTRSGNPADDMSLLVTRRGIIGTPAYMSPEAAKGALPSSDFDLWSLSVVLFEGIAGQRPFAGSSADDVLAKITRGEKRDLASVCTDCPAVVAQFFDRALAAELERRPRTAGEFRRQLLALQPAGT